MAIQINDLNALITKGKAQGFLTYNEISTFLPDETTGAEKLDTLVAALEGSGIELCDEPPAGFNEPSPDELIKAETGTDIEEINVCVGITRYPSRLIAIYHGVVNEKIWHTTADCENRRIKNVVGQILSFNRSRQTGNE